MPVKMRGVIWVCVVVSVCQAFGDITTDLDWKLWTRQFGKTYSTADEVAYRKAIWLRNAALVREHNNQPGASFRMGLNEFSDQITPNRSKVNVPMKMTNSIPEDTWGKVDIPKEFDWRAKGYVPPVENQGQLGSSLSFSARDAVVSFTALRHGKPLLDLSVQEVADCCGTRLMPDSVFDCVHKAGGLCLTRDYHKSNCRHVTCASAGQVDGGKFVTRGNETALQIAVLQAPVFVTVDASHASFQMYQSGVYNEPSCSSTLLDHTLLLVGYGTDSSGIDFWICKNSWGTSWGMQGYVYMSRNKNNQCGIASLATYPV